MMCPPPQSVCETKSALPSITLPNYFTDTDVAARYAKVRPFFHEDVIKRLCAFTGAIHHRRALDVGCGSGQSSIALASVADHVIAIDASQEMLCHAPSRPNINYQLGFAEELNFAVDEFDLISVGSALHWFDQHRFFSQCAQVLDSSGVLLIFNDHFTAHLQDVVECKRWMRTRFAKRFPPPRRGMRDLNEQTANECGFEVVHRASFSHIVAFSRLEFISYLLTRSNTLAAIHSGKEAHPSILEWLDEQLAPIIPDGVIGSFIFKCNMWIMRKATAAQAKRCITD
ncbi:MAG TPA: methyltransferase domain-containing protein [Candidatus Saccharimonadales bacterium]|nr:methyltransferase domain-containing protein [Candidatus Saccharimonadales bacterium]